MGVKILRPTTSAGPRPGQVMDLVTAVLQATGRAVGRVAGVMDVEVESDRVVMTTEDARVYQLVLERVHEDFAPNGTWRRAD